MIKVENVDVWGLNHAARAMRNPMNSWDKSDSEYVEDWSAGEDKPGYVYYRIGDHDLDLMKRLYKAGPEHRTYARMIQISMEITAPLYWWKEMDRYTVGKSQCSTSTMHKIHSKEFTTDDFSIEHLSDDKAEKFDIDVDLYSADSHAINASDGMHVIIQLLNEYRDLYLETKDKKYWWQLIQLLPSSYNQKRTICMSYETIFKIIKERTGHKLDEWNEFVEVLKDLSYVKDIMEE